MPCGAVHCHVDLELAGAVGVEELGVRTTDSCSTGISVIFPPRPTLTARRANGTAIVACGTGAWPWLGAARGGAILHGEQGPAEWDRSNEPGHAYEPVDAVRGATWGSP